MKKIILLSLTFLSALIAGAQTSFFPAINVEFEKVVYVHQQYKELEPEWFEQIKENLPQTHISYFQFIGDTLKSIYKPGKETPRNLRSWYQPVGDKNVVFTDFTNHKYIALKPVFEETFLVEDSLPEIEWKITADTRTIAGFDCRKAIGILDDSIAIFAFYTDELLVTGGPESIQGLPGMILGVGIPRLHTTWFATKVEVNGVNLNAIIPATKGKKVTRQIMMQSLDNVMKNWGNYGSKFRINFVI